MKARWVDKVLVPLSPCGHGLEWARGQPSLAAAWQACERGDYLVWYAGILCPPPAERPTPERARLVLAACECAEVASHAWQSEEPAAAVGIARQWALGDKTVTLKDVEDAADASAADASAAARAAAHAAAAAANADYATYAADVTFKHTECADIMRRYYPEPPDRP